MKISNNTKQALFEYINTNYSEIRKYEEKLADIHNGLVMGNHSKFIPFYEDLIKRCKTKIEESEQDLLTIEKYNERISESNK